MVKFYSHKVEKIVGKGENNGKPAFSSFPTIFSKGLFFQDRENLGLFGKGLTMRLLPLYTTPETNFLKHPFAIAWLQVFDDDIYSPFSPKE